MQQWRRTVAVVGLVVMTAGACGGAPTAEDPPAEVGSGATRQVEHARGTAEITGMPERVVVLDTGELDAVLALGVTPVGAVSAFADSELQTYLGDRTQGVEIVGTIAEPNLEAIAALRPDLILSSEVRHPEIYDELNQIAPTVFAADVGVAWKDTLRLAGEAVGRSEEADRVLADYRQAAEETGRQFGDPAETSVSMVRFVGDAVRLYGRGSFIGTILDDAGFARPPVQQVDVRRWTCDMHARMLKARAAMEGQPLSEFALGELRRSLHRPTRRELDERVRARHPAEVTEPSHAAVRAERDAR